ncbi:Sensor kinase CusS [Urinicoccus massiliensis]|uniref:histidine kinase n=1 Tax=Urinicoccus massiliensis TaxID=1723382 RepID=A0A8H2M679_9FIRM|nr:ATP-binding protein [Urinicoccus massiliensis]VFB17252.1 Sensor kinase CusS [Urinicoccus massiliensis]
MKKPLSLKMRFALILGLMILATGIASYFLQKHAINQELNLLQEKIMDQIQGGQLKDMGQTLIIVPEVKELFQGAQEKVQIQAILSTLAVVVLGSLATYFLARRSLKPLERLIDHMKDREMKNLSKPLPSQGLPGEIADLTQSYNHLLKRLDGVFQQQRQFSAAAAHELRTPLSVLQTRLDVFNKLENHQEKDYEEMLSDIQDQVQRMTQLVDHLLTLMDTESLEKNDLVDLYDLFDEVFCDLTPLAEKREVGLELQGSHIQVYASDLLLYRALYNLVENAIKYNKPGGSVLVQVKEVKDQVLVSVKDTGIGLAPESIQEIFTPFYRVDPSRSRKLGGAGLGLSLVKHILDLHQATISIDSQLGSYTEFTIWLGKK